MEALLPFYLFFKYLLIFLDAILVFVIFFVAAEIYSFRPPFVFDPRVPAKKHFPGVGHGVPHGLSPEEQWRKITARLADEAPDSWRLAIIEADGFVDSMMKKKGYEGDTFADRLSLLDQSNFNTLDLVWGAHRLRNDLVHTHGFTVTSDRARQALVSYEAFLKELGILEGGALAPKT